MLRVHVQVLRAHQGDADVAEAACFLLSAVAKDAAAEVWSRVVGNVTKPFESHVTCRLKADAVCARIGAA